MPRPKDPYLADARRAAILRIAAGEFAAHGYRGASYNRILRRASISKGSAYHHFKGKADLFGRLLESLWMRWIAFVGMPPKPRTKDGFWEGCEVMYHRSLQFFREEPATAGLIRTLAQGNAAPTLAKLRAEMRDWGRAFLRHGQSLGAIRDDLPEPLLLEIFLCLSDGIDLWCAEYLQRFKPGDEHDLAAQFVRLFRRLAEPERRDERWRYLWDKARHS